MKRFYKNNRLYVIFDSITESQSYVKKLTQDSSIAEYGQLCSYPTRGEFNGRYFGSWNELFESLTKAVPEDLLIVTQMIREIEKGIPEPETIRRRPVWSEESGEELDVDRIRSGQPYWRSMQKRSLVGPSEFTIVVSGATSASVNAKNVLYRGAAAIALAELMEQAGYRTEIYLHHSCTETFTDGSNHTIVIPMKQFEDSLCLTNLVNQMSGWYHRTIRFGQCYGHDKDFGLIVDSALGYPEHLIGDEVQRLAFGDYFTTKRITIHNVWSHQQAVAFVQDQMDQLT